MPADPWSGARYPQLLVGSVNVPQDLQNTVTDLTPSVCPAFTTTSARNTAAAARVAAGFPLSNGLTCTVAGYPQVYRSGGWHGTSSFVLTAAVYTGPAVTSTTALRTIAVPDPGYSYQCVVDGTLVALVSSGSLWTFEARVDTVGGELIRPFREVSETTYVRAYISGGVSSTLTGAHNILFQARIESGPGGSGFNVWNTTSDPSVGLTGENQQAYRVQVIPA